METTGLSEDCKDWLTSERTEGVGCDFRSERIQSHRLGQGLCLGPTRWHWHELRIQRAQLHDWLLYAKKTAWMGGKGWGWMRLSFTNWWNYYQVKLHKLNIVFFQVMLFLWCETEACWHLREPMEIKKIIILQQRHVSRAELKQNMHFET